MDTSGLRQSNSQLIREFYSEGEREECEETIQTLEGPLKKHVLLTSSAGHEQLQDALIRFGWSKRERDSIDSTQKQYLTNGNDVIVWQLVIGQEATSLPPFKPQLSF